MHFHGLGAPASMAQPAISGSFFDDAEALLRDYSTGNGVVIDPENDVLVIRDPVTPGNDFYGSLINPATGLFNKLAFSRPDATPCATRKNAQGLLELVPANVPRISYEPYGRVLLMEGARTNLLAQSQDFSQAVWLKNVVSVTAAATTAPDGTLTAALLTATAGAGAHRLAQVAAAPTAPSSFSVYAKAGTHQFLQLYNGADTEYFTNFDLSVGTIGTVGSKTTATISREANGFYRCSVIFGTSGVPNGNVLIGMATTSNSLWGANLPAATGSETLYLWGAQYEAGAWPSSYIPTTTAAVTRAAETCTLAAALFNLTQSASTQYTRFSMDGGSAVSSGTRSWSTVTNAGATMRLLGYNNAGAVNGLVTTSGSTVGLLTASSITDGQLSKSAFATDATSRGLSLNGASAVVDNTAMVMPSGMDTYALGQTGLPLFGGISRAAFLGTRVANAGLQSLTA